MVPDEVIWTLRERRGCMAQRSLAVEKRSYRAEAITQAAGPMLRPQGCESESSRGSRWLNTRQRGAGKCAGLQRPCSGTFSVGSVAPLRFLSREDGQISVLEILLWLQIEDKLESRHCRQRWSPGRRLWQESRGKMMGINQGSGRR